VIDYKELVDRYIPLDRDAIIVSLSGGLDSALLLYLTMLKISEQKATTKLLVTHFYEKPITLKYATKIYRYCQSQFPEIESNFIAMEFYRDSNGDKNDSINSNFKTIIESRGLDAVYVFWGLTKALPELELPPIPEQYLDQRDPTVDPELSRQVDYTKSISQYLPFTHINKHDIRDMYEQLELSELEESTLTCGVTNNDIPCMDCWWCDEKKLAFGYF
jgi:7-cyano-7-deazaguanine synthase in queuosine biosynthesis